MGQLILILILTFFSQNIFGRCVVEDVQQARSDYEAIEKLYRARIRPKSDLDAARNHLQEISFCAGNKTITEYCRTQLPASDEAIRNSIQKDKIFNKVSLLESNASLKILCGQSDVKMAAYRAPIAMNPCGANDVKLANENYHKYHAGFRRGHFTVYDLDYAEDAVMETKLCAGQSEADFCRSKYEAFKRRMARHEGKSFHHKIDLLREISAVNLRCQQELAVNPSYAVCDDNLVNDARKHLINMKDAKERGYATNRAVSGAYRAFAYANFCANPTKAVAYCESYIPRTDLPEHVDFRTEDTVSQEFNMENRLCRSIRPNVETMAGRLPAANSGEAGL